MCAAVVGFIASLMSDSPTGSSPSQQQNNPGPHASSTLNHLHHLLGDDAVAVKASKIVGAGLGAFALRSFSEGDRVGQYRCTVIDDDPSKTTGVFSWFLNSTHACDGEAHRLGNPMRYVNSIASLRTCSAQNVVVHPDDRSATVTYTAVRHIDVGEELIVDYGEAYFKTSSVFGCSGILYECDAPAMHVASGRGDLREAAAVHSTHREE